MTTDNNSGGLRQGLLYGIIPHIGCIAFVLASVLGSTLLVSLFKPLLMNQYLFYWIMGISFGFALVAAATYLYRNGMLSIAGVKTKRNYLSIMFGTTIGINLLLFLFIFPLLANYSIVGPVNSASGLNTIVLKVAIPCSGHASLITGEIKTLPGIQSVVFGIPNKFTVVYNNETSKESILGLSIFETYPATEI